MSHKWHYDDLGQPKTSFRRTCKSCRLNGGKGRCLLPFRRQLKLRWLAKFDAPFTRVPQYRERYRGFRG
jgi:hypothetical protein